AVVQPDRLLRLLLLASGQPRPQLTHRQRELRLAAHALAEALLAADRKHRDEENREPRSTRFAHDRRVRVATRALRLDRLSLVGADDVPRAKQKDKAVPSTNAGSHGGTVRRRAENDKMAIFVRPASRVIPVHPTTPEDRPAADR